MDSLKNRISSLEEIIHSLNKRIASLEEIVELSNNVKKVSKSSLNVKEKKTNHPGPGSWNEFVKVIWRQMLEEEGHAIPEDDDEFKKLANQVGITYKQALSEASKRKAENEGVSPKIKKEKEESSATATQLLGEDEDEETTLEMKKNGCSKKIINAIVYYYNPKSKEVFDMSCERIGKFVKGVIDETK